MLGKDWNRDWNYLYVCVLDYSCSMGTNHTGRVIGIESGRIWHQNLWMSVTHWETGDVKIYFSADDMVYLDLERNRGVKGLQKLEQYLMPALVNVDLFSERFF